MTRSMALKFRSKRRRLWPKIKSIWVRIEMKSQVQMIRSLWAVLANCFQTSGPLSLVQAQKKRTWEWNKTQFKSKKNFHNIFNDVLRLLSQAIKSISFHYCKAIYKTRMDSVEEIGEIVIVGGGPVGNLSAVLAGFMGAKTTVYEKR